ncbi:hypothetical protein RZN22_13525 [Bacillaceae bacterium S4-13-58]
MRLSEYFQEVYPLQKEKMRSWNRYVEQFEDTECEECGEARIIGETVREKINFPQEGEILREFSEDGQALLYCPNCKSIMNFDKHKLIFVKHYDRPIWYPFLLK